MQTIQIDNTELENFISLRYSNDKATLVNDIKKGFDEVESYKQGNTKLTSARAFLDELKSEC